MAAPALSVSPDFTQKSTTSASFTALGDVSACIGTRPLKCFDSSSSPAFVTASASAGLPMSITECPARANIAP